MEFHELQQLKNVELPVLLEELPMRVSICSGGRLGS